MHVQLDQFSVHIFIKLHSLSVKYISSTFAQGLSYSMHNHGLTGKWDKFWAEPAILLLDFLKWAEPAILLRDFLKCNSDRPIFWIMQHVHKNPWKQYWGGNRSSRGLWTNSTELVLLRDMACTSWHWVAGPTEPTIIRLLKCSEKSACHNFIDASLLECTGMLHAAGQDHYRTTKIYCLNVSMLSTGRPLAVCHIYRREQWLQGTICLLIWSKPVPVKDGQ